MSFGFFRNKQLIYERIIVYSCIRPWKEK